MILLSKNTKAFLRVLWDYNSILGLDMSHSEMSNYTQTPWKGKGVFVTSGQMSDLLCWILVRNTDAINLVKKRRQNKTQKKLLVIILKVF